MEALHTLLGGLPTGLPPIIITQHMPDSFMAAFAERLQLSARVPTQVVAHAMPLQAGNIYVAGGQAQFEIRQSTQGYVAHCQITDRIGGHLPSVEPMLQSVAKTARNYGLGVMLTGMGGDGAEGMLALRNAGGHTIAQNAASCVVYGMPRRAVECGGVVEELPLGTIAASVLRWVQRSTQNAKIA